MTSSSVRSISAAEVARWQAVFGGYHAALRARRDVSNKELADKIGVSPAAFSSWWRRHSVPKESQIAKLAYELAERDLVKAHRIEQDLLEALKGSDQAADGMTPLIRAQRGETIKLGVVKYSAFSNFFSSIGRYAAALCRDHV